MSQVIPLPLPQTAHKSASCEISEELSKNLSGTLPLGLSLSVQVDVRSFTTGPKAMLFITIDRPMTILTEREKTAVLQLANIFSASIPLAVQHVLIEEKSLHPCNLAGEFKE